ncbi:ABC transporter permease subunit [Oceanospirillaceae bacterium]|jgi:general L-amino acid transport system permease protein|uniref:amino acid ABC transporter permease n=1 Tax=Candidatus Njordibacter sp. Uisw_002 TaxID=3230971 RepID=UPI0023375EC7|nr:ABC transporter permease subunit [Oceanospirillaceae bacterium]MDB9973197.1 ABC transporter permease subunit [Oceanospirillaceae bacterium]|tara:strand:+ start:837 stop:2015 length:1179 start_codon:yes stop_codon:yes gene_type:complete
MSTPTTNPLLRAWYDKETRSVIIQIIAAALIISFFAYIINNAVTNLAAIGKDINFGFLWQNASYDINQTLIEYSSTSSHFEAMIVGLINTLLVAVAGIFLATILGFLLGIMRLSSNWLTQKIAYVYIEYIRNVPVLLHILLLYGVILNALPRPKSSYNLNDTFFLNNRGLQMPSPEFESLFWVVAAFLVGGLAFSLWFKRYAKKIQDATGKIYPVGMISIGAIVLLPMAVYFLIGSPIVWDVPALKGFNFKGGIVLRPEFIALWLALSLYTAAFIGEIVRAGIIAISHGQTEAAQALGLSNSFILKLVVIPQALRVIIPPLTSQYLNLAKNSSLALAIGYMDVVATIGGISLNQTGREMECMLIVMAIYLAMSLLISSVMNWYNDRIQLVER